MVQSYDDENILQMLFKQYFYSKKWHKNDYENHINVIF